MSFKIQVVDAFTDKAFGGNPAAVCVLSKSGEDDPAWMQAVAREMNLSETAFVRPRGDGSFDLRWFTPTVEVDLCGHATLAAAHVLWNSGRLAPDREARFQTASGMLSARMQGQWVEMDFPSEPAQEAAAPRGLLKALGAEPVYVGRNRMDYLVEVRDGAALRALQPDMRKLKAVPTRGVIVTSRGDDGEYDFVSRFFAPAAGIDEDPVTGSAHCCLGPYWMEGLGKARMIAFQASRRGGVVGVEVRGSRVLLRGRAVTVLRGELAT